MFGHILSNLRPLYNENIYKVADLVFDYLYVFGNNVAMFSLISGFFIAKSGDRIKNFKDYFRYIFKRYLRFSVPCFFAVFFAYGIQQTIGFEIRYESFGMLDMLKFSFIGVFCGDNSLNSPFWMMGDIFWGSIIGITICFADNIINTWSKKKKIIYFMMIAISILLIIFLLQKQETVFSSIKNRWVIWDVIVGMIFYRVVKLFPEKQKINKDKKFILVFLLIHIIGVVLRNNYSIFYPRHTLISEFWLQFSILECIAVFMCVIISSKLQNFFSNRLLVWLGKRSFWIFALHSPVICSVTYNFAKQTVVSNLNQYVVIFGTLIITISIVTVFSELFYLGEKQITAMLK